MRMMDAIAHLSTFDGSVGKRCRQTPADAGQFTEGNGIGGLHQPREGQDGPPPTPADGPIRQPAEDET